MRTEFNGLIKWYTNIRYYWIQTGKTLSWCTRLAMPILIHCYRNAHNAVDPFKHTLVSLRYREHKVALNIILNRIINHIKCNYVYLPDSVDNVSCTVFYLACRCGWFKENHREHSLQVCSQKISDDMKRTQKTRSYGCNCIFT